MSWRIAEYVEYGYVMNTSPLVTRGRLKFRGYEEIVSFDLVGNCSPDLRGWHIEFTARPSAYQEAEVMDEEMWKRFHRQQIGPAGMMTAAEPVRVTLCPPEELLARCKAGEPPPSEWKPCLTLEWFSQNGRVLIQLVDPEIDRLEYVDVPLPYDEVDPREAEPEEEIGSVLGIAMVQRDDDGNIEIREGEFSGPEEEAEGEDDPYGLFPKDLQGHIDHEMGTEEDGGKDAFIAEMELMDTLMEESEGDTLASFVVGASQLPDPDTLDERQAEAKAMGILAQLAMYGIALDLCEHSTPLKIYRTLVEDILPNGRAHRELRGTGWVHHECMYEHCEQCQAEFEAEYPDDAPPEGSDPR